MVRLPPTSSALTLPETRPYFLWWTDATVADLRRHLGDPDPEVRAYWLGALLREANTRDVWLFTDAAKIRDAFPRLRRYLGRSRSMWEFLLGIPRARGRPRRRVRSSFDRRVVPDAALALVRACQARVPCHLAGGAALSGAYLAHRLSNDLDLFCHDATEHRQLVHELSAIGTSVGVPIVIVRDSPSHVRATAALGDLPIEIDIVHESLPDLEPPPPPIDSIVVESLTDLRAAKLTCLLSRSEPRDLVDVLFLERAGYLPEADLALALRKDAGVDPGVLAWLLASFPVEPLPKMLLELGVDELRAYRDALSERMRTASVP